jgi:hypothetical protein
MYHWNRLDEPLATESDIYHGVDSCVDLFLLSNFCILEKHRVEYLVGRRQNWFDILGQIQKVVFKEEGVLLRVP